MKPHTPRIEPRPIGSHLLATLAVALALQGELHAAVFKVGTDAACTHTSIQDAIDAAALNGPGLDSIRIARNGAYANQALIIDAQALIVRGGYADCGTNTLQDSQATVIDAAENGALPALRIRNAGKTQRLVQLSRLEIRNAGASATEGGGVQAIGHLDLQLYSVNLHHNQALRGGGVYARGNSASARLNLQVGTTTGAETGRIETNHALSGGGLYVDAHTQASISEVRIADNRASFGGGIYFAPGSGGNLSLGSASVPAELLGVQHNMATVDGGGIYVESGSSITTTRYAPENNYRITGNESGRHGGGLFVAGLQSAFFGHGLILDDNRAGITMDGDGGGAYATAGGGVLVIGAVGTEACPINAACASVSGNQAGLGVLSGRGGALYAAAGGRVSAFAARLTGNSANDASVAMATGSEAQLDLSSALLTGNGGLGSALVLGDNARASLRGVTLANDAGFGALITIADADLDMRLSVVHAPGRMVLFAGTGVSLFTQCVISHQNFDAAGDVRVIDPGFVDPVVNDFHLRADSNAVDACVDSDSVQIDAENQPRGVDLDATPNLGGPFDIGALERQPAPEIHANGFES